MMRSGPHCLAWLAAFGRRHSGQRLSPKSFAVFAMAALAPAPGLEPAQDPSGEAQPGGPRSASPRLESTHLAVEFAAPASGLGVVAIEHRSGRGPPARFLSAPPEGALLWRIVFRGPGEKAEEIRVDNRAPCDRSFDAGAQAGKAVLEWRGINLPGENDAVDVRVEVELTKESTACLWEIAVENRSARLGPWEVEFPVLAGFGEKGRTDVAMPRGNWGVLERGASGSYAGYYPSNDWPMQFILAGIGDRGLIISARDFEAWPKRFRIEPGGEMALAIYPQDRGKPGGGVRFPFEVSIEAYRGSWWTGAKLYRAWALKAPWASRGPISSRKDFPEALRRVALWWLASGAPSEVVPRMKEAAKRFDVPLAAHWYSWHEIPFDVNYPEYFPTKPGFADGVRDLVAGGERGASPGAPGAAAAPGGDKGGSGMTVMPYINGRLWDVAGPDFPAARPAACKQPGGAEVYIETYGSGAKLAPMCPATKLWQEKVGEIVRRLGDECGVNAVYIDQIGSAGPVICHDPTHGHPVGGGGHWVGGYRAMLQPIREFAASRGMVLTTENNAEPYMDTIDGFLIWLPRSPSEIPLITAVYSGHAVYFSSPSREGMEPDAFAMVQGRDLLWGCQLGWMDFQLLDPSKKEQADYLLECGRYRRILEKFLLEGELLAELDLAEPPPDIEAKWGNWQGTFPARLPSVATAVWRAPDGHLAILAANLSKNPRTIAYPFDASRWGLKAARVHLERLRPGRREDLGEAEASFRRSDRLGPRDILAIEVAPR